MGLENQLKTRHEDVHNASRCQNALLLVVRPGVLVASLLLVVRPRAPSSFLLLLAMPFATPQLFFTIHHSSRSNLCQAADELERERRELAAFLTHELLGSCSKSGDDRLSMAVGGRKMP